MKAEEILFNEIVKAGFGNPTETFKELKSQQPAMFEAIINSIEKVRNSDNLDFAQWVAEKCKHITGNSWSYLNNEVPRTTQQLYEIFKTTKH